MKDFGLNLRPVGLEDEPSAALRLEAGFDGFLGKADFSRCTARRGGGEPAAALGVDGKIPREVEVMSSGCISDAFICSTLLFMSCTSLSLLVRGSLGEGAVKASIESSSRVVSGFFRADCLGRGLILGGIVDVEMYQ